MTAVETFWALPQEYHLMVHRKAGGPIQAAIITPNWSTGRAGFFGSGPTQEAACAEALEKLEKAK